MKETGKEETNRSKRKNTLETKWNFTKKKAFRPNGMVRFGSQPWREQWNIVKSRKK